MTPFSHQPPRLALWLLSRLSHYEDKHSIQGDLTEAYRRLAEQKAGRARFWFWRHVLRAIPPYLSYRFQGILGLSGNIIKTACRHLFRHRLYVASNVFGMAIGLAITLMVLGMVNYELSFEDSHINKNRIYRINSRYKTEKTEVYSARVMAPLGPAIVENLPEVEASAVFRVMGDLDPAVGTESYTSSEKLGRQGFEHTGNVFCANTDFLKVFTVPLVTGDAAAASAEAI